MKVKVINKAWYKNTLYDPETSGEIIIEYTGEKTPSWAAAVEKAKIEKQEGKKEETGGKSSSIKVSELPVTEKNALLEKAKAAGIEGNQILNWKVETLKAKIEEAEK